MNLDLHGLQLLPLHILTSDGLGKRRYIEPDAMLLKKFEKKAHTDITLLCYVLDTHVYICANT